MRDSSHSRVQARPAILEIPWTNHRSKRNTAACCVITVGFYGDVVQSIDRFTFDKNDLQLQEQQFDGLNKAYNISFCCLNTVTFLAVEIIL